MRLEVTRQADLAIRALVTLGVAQSVHANGSSANSAGSALEVGRGRLSARYFAEQFDTSAGFMSQVMNPLVKAGWISSVVGRTGGYRLEVPLDSLTVLDVVQLIDGPVDDGRCIVVGVPCESHEPCPLHSSWAPARKVLIDALGEQSLDLVKLGY